MRIAACVASILACLATSATAQPFQDLDFDSAIVPMGADGFPVPFLQASSRLQPWVERVVDIPDA